MDEGLRVVKEMVANQQLSQTRSALEPHEVEEPFPPEARVQVHNSILLTLSILIIIGLSDDADVIFFNFKTH